MKILGHMLTITCNNDATNNQNDRSKSTVQTPADILMTLIISFFFLFSKYDTNHFNGENFMQSGDKAWAATKKGKKKNIFFERFS